MKTPKEIKKGLELCCVGRCSECPYKEECDEHLACGGDMLPADVVLNDIAALIQQLEAAQPKWISVEERLPQLYKKVITIRKVNSDSEMYRMALDCTTLWIDDTYVWCGDMNTWKDRVTHWMPLPEPPKEENT